MQGAATALLRRHQHFTTLGRQDARGRRVYLAHEDTLHAAGQQGDGAALLALRSDARRQDRRGVMVRQIRQHLLHGTQATGQQ